MFINAPVTKAADLLKDKRRELWFSGITIGQWGFGFLVSKKRYCACTSHGLEYLRGDDWICGYCKKPKEDYGK